METKRGKLGGAWKGDGHWKTSTVKGPVKGLLWEEAVTRFSTGRRRLEL